MLVSRSIVLLFVGGVIACGASASSPTPRPTPGAPSAGNSCLMVSICGCNMGCGRVNVAPSLLRDGAKVRVDKGPLMGTEAKIIEMVDASGTKIFTLSDRTQNMPCATDRHDGALVSYVCATDKFGPPPSRACANACD